MLANRLAANSGGVSLNVNVNSPRPQVRRQRHSHPVDPNRCRKPRPWPRHFTRRLVTKHSPAPPPHGRAITVTTGYGRKHGLTSS